MIMVTLMLSLAALQQRSIDDDWARVASCQGLAAFRARWGARNRYSGYHDQVSRRYGCSSPTTRQQPRQSGEAETTSRPGRRDREPAIATTRPPAPLQTVILDASGQGHATTLAAALDRVANGGLILIRPGTYWGGTRVFGNVTLRGIADAEGNVPTLQATGENEPVILISGGQVTMEALNLKAYGQHASALYMIGGSLNASNVRFSWSGTRIANHSVAGHASVFITGGSTVTIDHGRFGPGETVALAVGGGASVTVTDSNITNPGGPAVFVPGGSLNLNVVTIANAETALNVINGGRAHFSYVLIHSLNHRVLVPVYLTDSAVLGIEHSIVCVPTGTQWASTRDNARIEAGAIFDANGARLDTTRAVSSVGDQAKTLCP